MKMRNELRNLYYSFGNVDVLLKASLMKRLSPPLLIYPTEKWVKSKKRLLIVGQETRGWGWEKGDYYKWEYPNINNYYEYKLRNIPVEALMEGYKYYNFAKYQPDNYRSPFWRAYRQLRKKYDSSVDGIETNVLWTNLFRMDLEGESAVNNADPEELNIILKYSNGHLLKEIKILNPTAVVFFTGHNYDCAINAEFTGVEYTNIENISPDKLCYVKHNGLPRNTIRTYHPGYLNRGHWNIIDHICKFI